MNNKPFLLIITGIIAIGLLAVINSTLISCKLQDNITNNYKYIDSIRNATIDSVRRCQILEYTNSIDSLQEIINDIQLDMDSYQTHCDSVADELLVAKYKLGRIEYYNKIAANGNNIKFLRGWINRVLKD